MILLIEPNRFIRKRLCDLLHRERIIQVGTYSETLEMIAKFKNNFNIIIANIRLLREILLRGTLFRLCQKLYIEIPPMLAVYRKGDEKIKEEFEKDNISCKLVNYDKDDTSFPERYLEMVKGLYPEVIIDFEKANENWLKGDIVEEPFDARKWLIEEGFLKAIERTKIKELAKDMEQIIPLIKKMLTTEKKVQENKEKTEEDYKKMYYDLKQKYDELLKYVKDLLEAAQSKK
jgi:hypothetical protein